MKYYKLLAGKHIDEQGRTYNSRTEGNNVIETEKDLLKAFGPTARTKFQPVGKEQYQASQKASKRIAARQEKQAAAATALLEDPDETAGERTDATGEFPAAAELGFAVYRQDDAFWVVESDNPAVALNQTGLKRSEVMKFVEDQA